MNEQYKALNVYEKLAVLKDAVKGFYKDGSSDKVKYVTGSQIYSKINPKMDELGLIFMLTKVTHRDFTNQTISFKSGDRLYFIVQASAVFEWVNIQNPTDKIVIETEVYGQQDEASKAFGSGLTYTERYTLLKSLGLPTDEEDPDKKKKEDNLADKSPATTNQVETIKELYTDPEKIEAICSYYKVKGLNFLTVAQASQIINNYHKKNGKN